MKTKKPIIAFLFVLLTAQAAFAFYSPETGRWLSRDPIGEPGFEALRTATQSTSIPVLPPSPSRWIARDPIMSTGQSANQNSASVVVGEPNRYLFVQNNPINNLDPLGLKCVVAIFPFHNITLGQGLDNYSILDYIIVTGDDGTCPACDIPKGTVFAMPPIYFFPRARTDDWLKNHTGTDIHKIYNSPPAPPRWNPPPMA